MNAFNITLPTADDFNRLGAIWRMEADGREKLGTALRGVLGNDLDWVAEAATLRRRAQDPQKYWPVLIGIYGPSSPVTVKADRTLPEGLYGSHIAEAAKSKILAAACCERCRTALQLSAQALRDLSSWVARHIHPSRGLDERAAWDAAEADHLGAWAEALRTEFLADVMAGGAC